MAARKLLRIVGLVARRMRIAGQVLRAARRTIAKPRHVPRTLIAEVVISYAWPERVPAKIARPMPAVRIIASMANAGRTLEIANPPCLDLVTGSSCVLTNNALRRTGHLDEPRSVRNAARARSLLWPRIEHVNRTRHCVTA